MSPFVRFYVSTASKGKVAAAAANVEDDDAMNDDASAAPNAAVNRKRKSGTEGKATNQKRKDVSGQSVETEGKTNKRKSAAKSKSPTKPKPTVAGGSTLTDIEEVSNEEESNEEEARGVAKKAKLSK